ncbi:MAG: hypothetical protein U0359_31930 [Byssovorax sp.]
MASERPPQRDDNPRLLEYVEHALAPYRDHLPPEDLEAFRRMLADFYNENPVASRLLAELSAAPVVDESGTVDRRGEAALKSALDGGTRRRSSGGVR